MNLVMFALWVVVGLLAGWLAGVVMKPGGYGLRGDILLGLVGSLVGGKIVWALGASPEAGMVAVAGVAFVGAAIVIVLQRKISARFGPRSPRYSNLRQGRTHDERQRA